MSSNKFKDIFRTLEIHYPEGLRCGTGWSKRGAGSGETTRPRDFMLTCADQTLEELASGILPRWDLCENLYCGIG